MSMEKLSGWEQVKKEEMRGLNRWSGLGLFWCMMGLSACGYSMLQQIPYINFYLPESITYPYGMFIHNKTGKADILQMLTLTVYVCVDATFFPKSLLKIYPFHHCVE